MKEAWWRKSTIMNWEVLTVVYIRTTALRQDSKCYSLTRIARNTRKCSYHTYSCPNSLYVLSVRGMQTARILSQNLPAL